MVPGTGLEPVRCFHREILSLLSLPISPSWHRCSRLTPALTCPAIPFNAPRERHSAPARFLTGVRLSPRSTLRQITYATTRKRARVCGRGISPLAYCRTPRRELHPTYRTIREMLTLRLYQILTLSVLPATVLLTYTDSSFASTLTFSPTFLASSTIISIICA